MSRAFVNEDAPEPEPRYSLPPRDDPDYDRAAAWALIEGAHGGDPYSAALATGYEQTPVLVNRGHDPQLERAVEEALRLLPQHRVPILPEPPAPVRARRPGQP